MLWYIAAPFFNRNQLNCVKGIEKAIEDHGDQYFSPRNSLASQKLAEDRSQIAKLASEIFMTNLGALLSCDAVVAYVRWAPEPFEMLMVRRREVSGGSDKWREAPSIPDSGTVWEMGWAFAHKKPIVGILGMKVVPNLMLARSCRCMFRSATGFRDWLANNGSLTSAVAWQGDVI